MRLLIGKYYFIEKVEERVLLTLNLTVKETTLKLESNPCVIY